MRDAGAHGRGLTARGCMLDLPQPSVRGHQRAQFRLGTVGRAIVDIDDLETRRGTKRGDNLGDQWRHIAGLIADRHDDRYGRRRFVRALLALVAHGLAGPCRPIAVQNGASFLWGKQPPGNPFDAPERGPRQRVHAAVCIDRKPEPARREVVAHEPCAHGTDDGRGKYIARIMREYHNPAERNDQCVGPHDRTQARPEETNADQRGERGGGMTGWQARIVRPPDQRRIAERVDLTVGKRPRPPDYLFDDGGDGAWHRYSREQECEPRRGCRNDKNGEAWPRRRRKCCGQREAKGDRNEKPPRLAEIGYYL